MNEARLCSTTCKSLWHGQTRHSAERTQNTAQPRSVETVIETVVQMAGAE